MARKIKNKPCDLCKFDTDDVLDFGEFKQVDNLRVHYYCLVSSILIG